MLGGWGEETHKRKITALTGKVLCERYGENAVGVLRKETLLLAQEITEGFTEMVWWSRLLDNMNLPHRQTDRVGHSKQQGCVKYQKDETVWVTARSMVWREQKRGKVENRDVVGEDGKKVGWGPARAFEVPSRSNRAGRSFEAGQGEIRSVVSKANPNANIVQGFWNPEHWGTSFFNGLVCSFIVNVWSFR